MTIQKASYVNLLWFDRQIDGCAGMCFCVMYTKIFRLKSISSCYSFTLLPLLTRRKHANFIISDMRNKLRSSSGKISAYHFGRDDQKSMESIKSIRQVVVILNFLLRLHVVAKQNVSCWCLSKTNIDGYLIFEMPGCLDNQTLSTLGWVLLGHNKLIMGYR